MEPNAALHARKCTKKRKKVFVVKESKFSSGVKKRWRFPRGKHSSVRQREKGRPALPQPGYGSPLSVRGLHSSGLRPVVVLSVGDMQKLDSQREGAVLGAKTGKRKKCELVHCAQEQKITILNMKDPSAYVARVEKELEERKKAKEYKRKKKSTKEEAKKKKAEEKANKEKKEKEKELEKKKEESGSVEDTVKDSEDKKLIEKTITKRQ